MGIVIQGRKSCKQWIKKYKLLYSTNNEFFLPLFDSK